MDRRDFIRLGIVGSVGSLIVPSQVFASTMDNPLNSQLAGSLFYTKEAPGRWAKKVGGHLPMLEKSLADDGKLLIKIETDHEMRGYKHYIIKHQLLDQNFQLLGETMFDPEKDEEPISHYQLDQYSGVLYAASLCNKHDNWINLLEV